MDQRFQATMALSHEERDFQLSPSRSAKDAGGFLSEMVRTTAELAEGQGLKVTRNISYGPHPQSCLDLFAPSDPMAGGRPALVFIHGGFWQEGDKGVSGFAARQFVSEGWAWVSVGYTLAPVFTLTEICAQVAEAVRYLRDRADDLGIDAGRIVLAGHSAGGHLAASILADVMDQGLANALAGVILISGVFELAPIAASYVNDLVQMSEDEVCRLSPLRTLPKRDVPVHVLAGGDEPEAFLIQSDALCALWSDHLTSLTSHIAPGRDHFDVLDELNDTRSPTWAALRSMV